MIEREIISYGFKEKTPLTLKDYLEKGGFLGFKKALSLSSRTVIKKLKKSGLRGRSGGGFPTGIKWETVLKETEKNPPSYIIVNAHEGEPFTFKDREILIKNPYLVIEGLLIAGYTLGSHKGIFFLNDRYVDVEKRLWGALSELKEKNLLGKNILKKGFDFEVEIKRSLPVYICGEESALVNVIEGKRPEPRPKPPYMAEAGLLGKPTLINNVETLANIPFILKEGEDWFASLGPSFSPGTKLICLEGDVLYPGIYEVLMGASLKDVIYGLGGGVIGNSFLALVGGYSAGQLVLPQHFDIPLVFPSFGSLETKPSVGVGTIIVFNDHHHLFDILENLARFFKNESCGRCASCREGTFFLYEVFKNKKKISSRLYEEALFVIETMKNTGLCGFSKMPNLGFASLLKFFKEEIVQ